MRGKGLIDRERERADEEWHRSLIKRGGKGWSPRRRSGGWLLCQDIELMSKEKQSLLKALRDGIICYLQSVMELEAFARVLDSGQKYTQLSHP